MFREYSNQASSFFLEDQALVSVSLQDRLRCNDFLSTYQQDDNHGRDSSCKALKVSRRTLDTYSLSVKRWGGEVTSL